MTPDFRALIDALVDQEAEFVVIGGVALVLRGSPRSTGDFDICYAREAPNLARVSAALLPLNPTLRGAPADLPFRLDERTLRSGLNFTLSTDRGDVDLLGEVTGVGGFAEVARDSTPLDLYGRRVLVMSLDALERAKRAAGRVKDLADLAYIAELKKKGGA